MNAFRSNRGHSARMDLLPPDRPQRSARATSAPRATDIIDADFETVAANSRRNVYPVFNDNHCRAAPRQQARVAAESRATSALLWAVNHLERLLQTASPKAFAVLVTCLCAPVFLLFAGLSNYQPAVAPALAISGVTTALSDANGMKIVSVYGAVENQSDAPKAVPMIQVDVIAGGRKSTASRIFPGEAVLAPGESRPFSARLPHAGGKLPDVTVSFGEKGDSVP
ncbi:hypothetical protein [Rhizobium giardinii]|jgi:hypothetical protein|uniref:Transmembrane protein n=1 Tax=Rhizobium giardinii TaxID=56731 RepID=A0A7W8X862_9HYPH|nr:hypothetical protein [Rhizobium giardinii]MBB5535202.1 hypothetical protein [Rhizobium giardinii]